MRTHTSKMSEESEKVIPLKPGESMADYALRSAVEKEPGIDPEVIIQKFVDDAGTDQLMLLRVIKAIDRFRKSLKPKKYPDK